MPKNYTVREVADILGFSTNSIYAFLKEKRLKGVRIGRGRFRIPEEELSRVLHLSKKQASPQLTVASGAESLVQTESEQTEFLVSKLLRVGVVNEVHLSDWFTGIAALVVGVSLFLFNQAAQTRIAVTSVPWIQLCLVVGGAGILLSSIYKKHGLLHRLFHVLLAAVALLCSWWFLKQRDIDGAATYGLFGVLMFVNAIYRIRSFYFIGIYITALALAIAAGFGWFPDDPHLAAMAQLLGVDGAPTLTWILAAGGVNLLCYWTAVISGNMVLFLVSSFIASVAFLWTGILYGTLGFWGRAFFYLVLSFFCLILPVWRRLVGDGNKRQRLFIHLMMGGVTGVLLLTVGGVYAMHSMLLEQRRMDFEHSIVLGKTLVESALTSVRESMGAAAASKDWLQASGEANTDVFLKNAKVLYESNPFIRRLLLLDAAGNARSMYPHGALEQENTVFREYFLRVKETGTPYVSSIFERQSDNAARSIVSITVPLTNSAKLFSAAISASVDLEKVALKLQQIVREENGEYFVVIDADGRFILPPHSAAVGDQADAVWMARINRAKQAGGATIADVKPSELMVFDESKELGWTIFLVAPVYKIVGMRSFTIMILLGTVFAVFLIIALFFELFRRRIPPEAMP